MNNNFVVKDSGARMDYPSGMRHMMQWQNGEVDEDHMSAVCFNLMCAEYVKDRLENKDDQ